MQGTMQGVRGMRGVRGIAISLIFTHDHIVGSSVELIEFMCFLKLTRLWNFIGSRAQVFPKLLEQS